MPGTLYLVATPIGNLQDISFRALETLRSVDLIACEDTRHTRNLLNHFRVSNRVVSYHEHNEQERSEEFAERLLRGESIAVVSDAGTPGICDPGYRVVRRAIESGIEVIAIPGAVAFVNAVVVSGLSTDSLFFGGFLPSKKGERRKRLKEVAEVPATLIFYEAPNRLIKSLSDCLDVLGDRQAAVVRELTKLHEEAARGRLSDLIARYSANPVKGEIVLVIERYQSTPDRPEATAQNLSLRLDQLTRNGIDHKTALKQTAKEFGMAKSDAYRIIQQEKDSK